MPDDELHPGGAERPSEAAMRELELDELGALSGPELPSRESGSDALMEPAILRRVLVEAELVEVARSNRIRRRAD